MMQFPFFHVLMRCCCCWVVMEEITSEWMGEWVSEEVECISLFRKSTHSYLFSAERCKQNSAIFYSLPKDTEKSRDNSWKCLREGEMVIRVSKPFTHCTIAKENENFFHFISANVHFTAYTSSSVLVKNVLRDIVAYINFTFHTFPEEYKFAGVVLGVLMEFLRARLSIKKKRARWVMTRETSAETLCPYEINIFSLAY